MRHFQAYHISLLSWFYTPPVVTPEEKGEKMEIAPVQLPEAESFPGTKAPNDAVEVNRIEVGNTVYIYYQDESGNMFYNTEAGLKFAAEMEKAQRKRKSHTAATE